MITAIDIGGTKTLLAQFSEDGALQQPVRFLTPQEPEDFLKELDRHMAKLSNVTSIVVGVAGRASEGVIGGGFNLPQWEGFELVKRLQAAYKCPVGIENDGNLAALSEINALNPTPTVGLYLTLSTGIGSGLVVNGELAPLLSRHSYGHIVLNHDGKWATWESFASGKNMARSLGKLVGDITEPQEWEWVAEQVCAGLLAIIHPVAPDVIIFGGSVGGLLESYREPLERMLAERLSAPSLIPQLRTAQHPNEAVLYGCYHYAIHQLSRS
jgi:predicted NBD/HSP70 family sugar kinase